MGFELCQLSPSNSVVPMSDAVMLENGADEATAYGSWILYKESDPETIDEGGDNDAAYIPPGEEG